MTRPHIQVGSLGRTQGTLRPAGKVVIEGKLCEARSQGEWIEADKQVMVVRMDAFGLVVREASADSAAALAVAEELRQQEVTKAEQERVWQRRRQRFHHLVVGAILGTVLGMALMFWLRVLEGGSLKLTDLLFPDGGLILGLIYTVGLQAFYSAMRESVSERLPETPGVFGRVVMPGVGCVAGAYIGYSLAGKLGAILGAMVGGMFLAPLLTVLLLLLAEFV